MQLRAACDPPQLCAELVPHDYLAPLDLSEVFSRVAPLEVDLGCGDGTFLVALAQRSPERNFLGIERLRGRVQSACGKIARGNLRNARLLRVESSYAVRYLLPAGSAAVVHLLFPDPWPKKRHHRRRLVTAEFLSALECLLVSGGRLRIATDERDYFHAIQNLARATSLIAEHCAADESLPLTTFEKHFRAAGKPIHRLDLRKIS